MNPKYNRLSSYETSCSYSCNLVLLLLVSVVVGRTQIIAINRVPGKFATCSKYIKTSII